MDESFVKNRITQLRLEQNISEYKLSLELGQNKGYIQSISSGRALPSMSVFFNICDYFNITPCEFFNEKTPVSSEYREALNLLADMKPEKIKALIPVMKLLNEK